MDDLRTLWEKYSDLDVWSLSLQVYPMIYGN